MEIILEESGLRNRAYFAQMEDGEVRAFVPITTLTALLRFNSRNRLLASN